MRIVAANTVSSNVGRFSVFYLTLSDEHRQALNSQGWDGEIGTAYLDAKGHFNSDPNYDGAIQQNMFELAVEITAMDSVVDPEQIWLMLQNRSRNWADDPPNGYNVYTSFPRSMDVGDIVYHHNVGKWFYCASVGFEEIENETLFDYLTDLREKTT